MTTSADHRPDSASRSSQPLGRSEAFRDELAKLRGRVLGDCAACGHRVYFEHNFMRLNGRVVHVRCPITAPRPTAPAA
jgi:hypothetical protein